MLVRIVGASLGPTVGVSPLFQLTTVHIQSSSITEVMMVPLESCYSGDLLVLWENCHQFCVKNK